MRTLRSLLSVALGATCLWGSLAVFAVAAETTAAPQPTSTPPPLSRGTSGKLVKQLQQRLTELGFEVGSTSGTFAGNTQEELIKFQRANGLEETGALDAQTAAVLYGSAPVAATPTPMPLAEAAPMPRTASALVAFLNSRLGAGYIYGTNGEYCSPWLREQRAEQYPSYDDSLMGVAEKWDGMEVYDCVGLFKAFLKHSQGEFPKEWNTNVRGASEKWMLETGTIDTMPREPGILLLQWDPETDHFMHLGIYAGDGRSIHARGHAYGVVEDPMPQLWTHWGRAVWLEYDLPAEEPVQWPAYLAAGDTALVDTSFGGDLAVRAQPRSDGAYTGARLTNQTMVTIDAVPEEPDAWFWRQVTTTDRKGNVVTGYVYAKDLTAVDEGEAAPTPAPQ